MPRTTSLAPADCCEFRQTLLASPPRFVHGTAVLSLGLVAAALVWSAATPVAEVVRVPGTMRSQSGSSEVVCPGGELYGLADSLRISGVEARPGDRVRKGQVLVRLDTSRLDAEIAKNQRAILTARRELDQVIQLESLAKSQHEAARNKAQADLDDAQEELRQQEARRAAALRLAEEGQRKAQANLERYEALARDKTATNEELEQKRLDWQNAQEALDKARLPVNPGKMTAMRLLLALEDANYASRQGELALQRETKQGAVESARLELARLQAERRRAQLRSPRDGVVVRGDLKAGDMLRRGRVAMVVAGGRRLLFEAVVPTVDAGHLEAGMPVRIKLHAFDYQRYGMLEGRVAFLAPDSRLVGPENRKQAAYVVKISFPKQDFGRGPWQAQARLGLEGTAEIVTGWRSLLATLVSRIRHSISLG